MFPAVAREAEVVAGVKAVTRDSVVRLVVDDGDTVRTTAHGRWSVAEDMKNRGKHVITLRDFGMNTMIESVFGGVTILEGVQITKMYLGVASDADDDEYGFDISKSDEGSEVAETVLITGTTATGAAMLLETATDGDLSDILGFPCPLPGPVLADYMQGGPGPALTALVDLGDHSVVSLLLSAPIGAGADWIRRSRQWVTVRDTSGFLAAIEDSVYLVAVEDFNAVEVIDRAHDGGGVATLASILDATTMLDGGVR